MKRVISLIVGALMLVAGFILASPASAHTPSQDISCGSAFANANSYNADRNHANSVVVTLDGTTVLDNPNFGAGYSWSANDLDLYVSHTLTVTTRAWDGAQYNVDYTKTIPACKEHTSTPPTSPPVTTPPVTSPPVTSPPVTSPPVTNTPTPTPTTSVPETPSKSPSTSTPVTTPAKTTTSSSLAVGPPVSTSRPARPVAKSAPLAETGVDSGDLLLIGIGVLILGAGFMAASRKVSAPKH